MMPTPATHTPAPPTRSSSRTRRTPSLYPICCAISHWGLPNGRQVPTQTEALPSSVQARDSSFYMTMTEREKMLTNTAAIPIRPTPVLMFSLRPGSCYVPRSSNSQRSRTTAIPARPSVVSGTVSHERWRISILPAPP